MVQISAAARIAGSMGIGAQNYPPEICEETRERLFRAGEYVGPGEYIEVETKRRLTLPTPDFLPARLDGHAACYRPIRHAWGDKSGRQVARTKTVQETGSDPFDSADGMHRAGR